MPLYSFQIGTTYGNLTNVESLATPLDAPRSTFRSYSAAIPLGDSSVRGGGWPTATWGWDFMTQAEYNAFKAAYCTGKSASVYINTKKGTGAYQVYTATLIWPDEEELEIVNGRILDVVVVFVNLAEYTP